MLARRKAGGLNERRFVVEITRPVPAGQLESAATYVAQRLGIDVARIRTLLDGRIGPVSRELVAEKAQAIAKVFGEAEVMVTVVERPPEAVAPEVDEQAADEVDFEYDGPADHATDSFAPPWHDETHGRPLGRRGRGVPSEPVDVERSDDLAVDEPATIDLRPSSTRWVPSPHAPDDDRTQGFSYEADDVTDPVPDSDPVPTTDNEPDRRHDDDEDVGEVFYTGRTTDDEELAAIFSTGPADDEDDEDDHEGRRPWLAPERSPFGDYDAAPHDRPQLRRYLLWGLALSLVVLVALQLLFLLGGRGAAAGADYDDGLAPYRSGDFVAARGIWEDAASQGDARAQYMLGYLVQNGLGQPWSNRQAAEWYEEAAAQGLPEAQTALARLYLEGLGVAPDAAKGLELLRTAAAAGHPAALYDYGELLFHGRWVQQDFGAALDAFERAAAGGSVEAADFVGLARYLGYQAGE